MKLKKMLSVLVALSMVAAVAGCSKNKTITGDDFIDACEKMGAEELDPEDTEELELDDYEDGIYFIMDSDYIEEHAEEAEDVADDANFGGVSISSGLPDFESVLEPDDIEQMVVYMQMVQEGTEDLDDVSDIEDMEIDGVFGAHITLTDEDIAGDFMENLADTLDDMNIDVDDLSSDEYSADKNGGSLVLHVDAQTLVEAFKDSETYDILTSLIDEDEINDSIENLTGDIGVYVHAEGVNIVVVVVGNVNVDAELGPDFCSNLGISNPTDVDPNEDFATAICDVVDDTVGQMIALIAAFSGL
ncbi:MAG: hypothetical protein IJ757_04740 [Clostridiales bacterium]|nr:hypothetical protein [Clostridiales bacterium]